MKTPQYILEGFRPHGPGKCRCQCGVVVSTNAFARSAHKCWSACQHEWQTDETGAGLVDICLRCGEERA